MPDRRPGPAEVAFTCRPGIRSVEVEANDRIGQSEFGILLDQIGDLIAGQVLTHHVGFGLPHFQKIGAEVRHVGSDQLVA